MSNNDTNATETKTMTRFDIPDTIAALLETAQRIQLCDARDVYALAVQHGDDWRALTHEILEWAFATIHTSPSIHKTICPLTDAVFAEFPRPKGVA